jgi:hypothetical protein
VHRESGKRILVTENAKKKTEFRQRVTKTINDELRATLLTVRSQAKRRERTGAEEEVWIG